jgi:UPF0716 protein FxsA
MALLESAECRVGTVMLVKLFILFIVVPLVELALLLTIGAKIGIWPTLAIIVSTAVLGASLSRREGLKTWWQFQEKLMSGAFPNEELLDGLLILVAGAVLLTPGFLTDALGFILLIPGSRRMVKDWLRQRYSRHIDTQFREL